MFCGLFKPSFRSKCKSLLRATLMRVELVQRKRRASERILMKDLADLLATRFELDAYKRAEGLLAEVRISSGYDFIEDSCCSLLRNIYSVGRRKECPEKCKEAVASLMFAAAWFSDLPESRDLRDLFHSRYGESMEFYVNRKFAESLKNKHYSVEKKLRLMEHVAAEFSVKWNSGNFKERICRDLVPADVMDQVMINESIVVPEERKEAMKQAERSRKGHRTSEGKEKAIISRVTWYSVLHHDKKIISVKYKPGAVNEKRKDARPKRQTHYLVGGHHGKRGDVRPSDINPTYHLSRDPQALDDELQQSELKRPVQQCQRGLKEDQLPDMRRRSRVKLPRGVLWADEVNQNKMLDTPIIVERKLGDPTTSCRTLQISTIQDVNEEEEERVIDELLIKYSRGRQNLEKLRIESKGQPPNQTSSEADNKLALVPFTTRSISLPKEQTAPAEQERALVLRSSCQPNILAPHVHPKLPDYDDLAAKFAELRQQQQGS